MPIDIVEELREVYRKKFMSPTLDGVPGEEMRLEAFDEVSGKGFPGSEIIVTFAGPGHPSVLASNDVQELGVREDGQKVWAGVIAVSPRVCDFSAHRRKHVLAHEWIEVMMAMRDEGRDGKKVDLERLDMVVMFSTLKMRCLWQDTPEFTVQMHSALRRLLVSEQSLAEMAEEKFGVKISDLKTSTSMSRQDVAKVVRQLRQLAEAFAGEWSVDRDLVYDRIREMLWA